jgi:hypothetical protein
VQPFFRRFETARTALHGVMKCDLLRIQIVYTPSPDVVIATTTICTVFLHARIFRPKERPA